MYYDYFGLKQPPFKITPDTSLFFPGGDRGAILDALIYAIVSGEGIVKLVGEVGSGKTTLCRMLEKELPENIEIVYLANPSLSPDNILHAIAFELDLKVEPDDSRLKVMNELQAYLLQHHAENKQVVVFIEEAQSMPIATLEEIRLLSNLETAQNKLLQIVIFGQPELDVMISKQEIRQLKERITYSFYLSPLKPDEIRDYINSRLRACGYRSVELFNEKAIKSISKYSNGLLRRINILADKAMLASYAATMNTVTAKHVQLAANETEFVTKEKTSRLQWALIFCSLVVISILVFYVSENNRSDFVNTANSASVTSNQDNEKTEETDTTKVNTASLMLLKDARGESKTAFHDQGDSKGSNETNVMHQSEKDVIKPIDPEAIISKPDPSEYALATWQKLDQSVYIYPEKIEKPVVARTEENDHSGDLLEINDLMKSVIGHSKDELALLKQLKILPSEAVINHNSVANELTCRLCSTIIYRPLKDDKNL